jgi:succinyl-CoA synthetase beta subunit
MSGATDQPLTAQVNLHEYQAKTLLARYGVPVPPHRLVAAAEEVFPALDQLGGHEWVIKAQVHAGGRGKAGGIRRVRSRDEARQGVESWLGSRLVTPQTGDNGKPINEVLIEQPAEIARELYLAVTIDRSRRRVVLMASTEGGMDIEDVAARTPDKILRVILNPLVGLQPFQCRQLAFGLGLEGETAKGFHHLARGLVRLFLERDLSLVEINPLAVTRDGGLLCIDAKINVDDNALYRQDELARMYDPRQEDPREVRAKKSDLSYVALDGDIGCMVNGAGLAMATMDLIKLAGGSPANFLDVGGTATRERVAEAFKIILADRHVKGVLVNIFGGIVRCDIIAHGIVGAVEEVGIEVPVVVRLEGTNAPLGREILEKSGLEIYAVEGLGAAAETIVRMVREGAR